MRSCLKHLAYDDVCSLTRIMDLGQWTLDFERESSRVRLKINTNKTKVLSMTDYRTLPICISGQSVEGVDQLVYLRSIVFADSDTVTQKLQGFVDLSSVAEQMSYPSAHRSVTRGRCDRRRA